MNIMFADQTLTPKEAVRFCALGLIAESPQRYAALAGGVRHFCSRIAGPSLDLMGMSIELLRYEGLVVPLEGQGMEDDALLQITDAGRKMLVTLLTARLRPASDLTKLVIALKMRFSHLLSDEQRQAQLDMLIDVTESELARLEDLASSSTNEGPLFAHWLAHEISQSREHLAWLEKLSEGN
jgi:DNA-binding PadR family transcriptional regulator